MISILLKCKYLQAIWTLHKIDLILLSVSTWLSGYIQYQMTIEFVQCRNAFQNDNLFSLLFYKITCWVNWNRNEKWCIVSELSKYIKKLYLWKNQLQSVYIWLKMVMCQWSELKFVGNSNLEAIFDFSSTRVSIQY